MKKKRIISLLLALLMGLGMFPSAAFATEAATCAVCGAPDCAEEHVQCSTCGEYDCTVDHAAAPAEEPVVCPACNTENCTAEHVYCAVCADYDCGLDHEAELCPVCKAADCAVEHVQCTTCGEYDCTVDHTAAPAQPPAAPTVDYSGDVGMYATVNPYFAQGYVEVFDGSQIYNLPYTDFAEGLVLTVADWHYDAGTGYLWYQVYVTVGQLPAAMADGWWIHQATAADNAEEKTLILTSPLATTDETSGDTAIPGDGTTEGGDTTTTPDDTTVTGPVICPICNTENCTQHVPCEICGVYNCTAQHVQCEICGKYDCTTQHVQCEACGKYDCTDQHVYCELCQKYDCGKSHVQCGICGEYDCTQHLPCEVCGVYNCGITHVQCGICGNYDCTTEHVLCRVCGTVDCTVDHAPGAAAIYSGAVGKYAALASTSEDEYIYVADTEDISESGAFSFYNYEFKDNTLFRIDDYYYEEETGAIWYKVSVVSGGVVDEAAMYWPAEAWIFYDYYDLTGTDETVAALTLVDVSFCPTCGQLNCTMSHFRCEVCDSYSCTATHLYCNACNVYDCPLEHTYCYTHKKYDCTETHQTVDKPITAPIVVPPSGSSGDVTIADRYGNVVTSLVLSGMRDTLSAWGANADYQWQVCYDAANNLWADIQGQSAQGIVLSPAMFLGAFSGEAYLRCRSGSGDAATYSAPVAVSFADPATETFRETVGAMLPQADEGTGNLSTQQIVVQYKYDDGRTAASTAVAQIITGDAFSRDYELPSIPGYRAEVKNANTYPGTVETIVKDGKDYLRVDFAANALGSTELTLIEVVFKPAPVKYTVIHYWQNIDNDYYTEHERQVVEAADSAYVTGQTIKEVEKSYSGFFNLLYDTPAAAADGSTVIEVYYDRYYYLMTFDLGTNGYGTDPIYARYGAKLDIETPTRAGYTFEGWGTADAEGNVTEATVPTTMPAGNMQYVAIWQPGDTAKVSVVFWGENPNDEEYSYLETKEIYAKPGISYTFSEEGGLICGYHNHDAGCYELICTLPQHNHTTSGCTLNCAHTHTLDCYSTSGGFELDNYHGGKSEEEMTNNGDGLYEYGTGFLGLSRHYYVKIGDNWYRSNNGNGNRISFNCTHTAHENQCYSCNLSNHTHSNYDGSCYRLICTEPTHTHTDSCYDNLTGLDPNLWTFVRSTTVTVEADGSTRVDVYYDRKEYYVGFYSNQDCTDDKEYTSLRITAKWGANILNNWPTYNESSSWLVEDKSDTWQNSIQIMPVGGAKFWGPKTGNNSYSAYYYVEALPGTTVDTIVHNGITYILHHTDVSSSSGNVTDEERYGIEGFTYKEGTDNGESYSGAEFYYTRNSYNLVFNDGYEDIHTYSVKYDAPLDEFTMLVPTAPSAYEPGSRVFAGWYLNPECTGEQVILTGKNMPAENIILYAKWELIERKVNYYLDKQALDADETIPEEMSRLYKEKNGADAVETTYSTAFAEDTVQHGKYIQNPSKPGVTEGYNDIHRYAGYDFVAWFYIDDEGKENAFLPENMPVDRDLNLYAKWSSNTLCQYNIYFALDANNDGVADTDASGKVIYVADPLNGSGIAGNTYTFAAAGGEQLYTAYKEGYFPTVGSHSITVDINDENGTITNHYTFLYQPQQAVPYGVRYLDKETGATLAEMYVNNGNTKIVVTEQFKYIPQYMPDEYQKTLVVTNAKDLVEDNIITFWYTKDTQHAIYVVNHYIQDLKADNTHGGWTKYTSLQSTGDIGTDYSADAISIDGFTLSADYTNGYNTGTEPINGATGTDLPSPVSQLYGSNNSINGRLTDKGMELNFYYTRNFYPYEFRFVLKDVGTRLASPEVGVAPYDTVVVEQAKVISLDLDNDGILEDYRLYDATETEKEIRIKTDGAPLAAGAVVTAGTATVNIATFEYIRCTQDISVKKFVEDKGTDSHPDPNQLYHFELKVHITDGYHKETYETQLDNGDKSTISHEIDRPDTICFTLKNGENFTIKGLPTARYTLTELPLPLGFTEPEYQYTIAESVSTAADGSVVVGETYSGNSEILQVEHPLHFTVKNTYNPAALEIKKSVNVVENDLNTPEISDFVITVAFPDGVELAKSYAFSVNGGAATQTGEVDFTKRTMTLTLGNGDTVRFPNLPTGTYTVTETDYSANGYKSFVKIDSGDDEESRSASVQLVNGETRSVAYTNRFPVGDLVIQKTVTKEFYNTPWDGDTFTFTVERTTKDRPLVIGNRYLVYEGETEKGTATVVQDNVTGKNTLTVEIEFDAVDAKTLETKGASAVHTYTIKNLPAGTYSVVEKKVEDDEQSDSGTVVAEGYDYKQSASGTVVAEGDPTVSGIVIPAAPAPKAEFTNELIRPTGEMDLTKLLNAASGHNANELPENAEFDFTIRLTEDAPESVTVSKTLNGETENVTMEGGSFEVSMRANQTVSFKGLPIGVYRVIEHSVRSYANTFEIKNENGQWVRQPATNEGKNLYTEIEVKADGTAEVHCVNIYPVERGELIIQKDFTKEYDRDELPANLSSEFKISFEERDALEYYYTVYEEDRSIAVDEYGNQLIDQTATVSSETENGDNDYYISITLKDGQFAVITGGKAFNDGKDLTGVPVCGFTITETSINSNGTSIGFSDFNVSYVMYRNEMASPAAEGDEVPAQLSGTGKKLTSSILTGYTHNVVFTNQYKQQLTDLTITKTGAAGTDENQSFIFTVNGPEGTGVTGLKVVINGNGSVTIRDLPIGTYTVSEDAAWSWRYTPGPDPQTIPLDPDANKNKLTFNNERKQPYWLSGDSVNENQFTVNVPTTTN